jgi:hypothetical protein
MISITSCGYKGSFMGGLCNPGDPAKYNNVELEGYVMP